jgi:hypothetical protein
MYNIICQYQWDFFSWERINHILFLYHGKNSFGIRPVWYKSKDLERIKDVYRGATVYISIRLTSLNLCTFNNREVALPPIENIVEICKQIIILNLHQVISRFVTPLKFIYSCMQVSNALVLTVRCL